MAILRALGSPLRRGVARDVLHLVHGVLHVGIKILARCDVFAAQRVAGVDREHRFDLQVLAPLQKFEQSKAVGRPVAPRRLMSGPIDHRANRLLPVEAVDDSIALEIVPSRQPQEVRMHRGHALHQVGAVAVRAIVVGGRKERHELQPELAGLCDGQLQVIRTRRLHIAGGQRVLITRPVAGMQTELRPSPAPHRSRR